jgi:hypothetical protein
VAPPERQEQTDNRTHTATYGDDRRRADQLGRGAGRHEGGPLANDHTHVGYPEGLSPPLVRYPDDEGGVGRDLVDTEHS